MGSAVPSGRGHVSHSGGGTVRAGVGLLITWGRCIGIAPVSVDIAFLTEGSDTNTIAEDILFDDYHYLWTRVADVNSIAACRIRISDASDTDPADISDTLFTVFQCDPTLTADLTGDCFVDIANLAEMARQLLLCGNPYDPTSCFE